MRFGGLGLYLAAAADAGGGARGARGRTVVVRHTLGPPSRAQVAAAVAGQDPPAWMTVGRALHASGAPPAAAAPEPVAAPPRRRRRMAADGFVEARPVHADKAEGGRAKTDIIDNDEDDDEDDEDDGVREGDVNSPTGWAFTIPAPLAPALALAPAPAPGPAPAPAPAVPRAHLAFQSGPEPMLVSQVGLTGTRGLPRWHGLWLIMAAGACVGCRGQVEGPTLKEPPVVGVLASPSAPTWKAVEATFQRQQLRMLSLEIHGRSPIVFGRALWRRGTEFSRDGLARRDRAVNTREALLPDPAKDAVTALFYCLQDERLASHTHAPALHAGYHPGYAKAHPACHHMPPSDFVARSCAGPKRSGTTPASWLWIRQLARSPV